MFTANPVSYSLGTSIRLNYRCILSRPAAVINHSTVVVVYYHDLSVESQCFADPFYVYLVHNPWLSVKNNLGPTSNIIAVDYYPPFCPPSPSFSLRNPYSHWYAFKDSTCKTVRITLQGFNVVSIDNDENYWLLLIYIN